MASGSCSLTRSAIVTAAPLQKSVAFHCASSPSVQRTFLASSALRGSWSLRNLTTTKNLKPHRLLTHKVAVSTEPVEQIPIDERVIKVHTIADFEETLKLAKDKLVVVEYAANHSYHSKKMYPFMVELSRSCPEVKFVLVIGDESEETKELCKRENITKVPHFSFYKSMHKIHDEEGIDPETLEGDVLYYGDTDAPIHQLHSRQDVEALIRKHKDDHKLVVLDVGLKHCGPCVKVYPTVVKLAKKMTDSVVFARMNGDESEECMEFLKEMDVIEVPTFLFVKDGKICGRYVGSARGDLIGEILRYQGVRVTY